jgi:hypothetical protein
MTRAQMKAMLDRGHRDVRIKSGPYASMAAKVTLGRDAELYLIRLQNQQELLAAPEDLGPAIPMGPDKFQEDQARKRKQQEARGESILANALAYMRLIDNISPLLGAVGVEPKPKPEAPDLLREYNDPRQQRVRECLERVGYTETAPGVWTLKEPEPDRKHEWKRGDTARIVDPKSSVEGHTVMLSMPLKDGVWRAMLHPTGPDVFLFSESQMLPCDPREFFDKGSLDLAEPKPPATIFTTHHGALAWQQAKPNDRKVHFQSAGHVLTIWATTLSSGYATREIKVEQHLPADEVGPLIDRAFSEPSAPVTVGHGYDGLDDLFANCG